LRTSVIREGNDEDNFASSSMGTIRVYDAYKKVNINVPLKMKKFKIKIDFGGAGIFFPIILLYSFSQNVILEKSLLFSEYLITV
jgi:hypothetical protein